jgi:hypothetical protein
LNFSHVRFYSIIMFYCGSYVHLIRLIHFLQTSQKKRWIRWKQQVQFLWVLVRAGYELRQPQSHCYLLSCYGQMLNTRKHKSLGSRYTIVTGQSCPLWSKRVHNFWAGCNDASQRKKSWNGIQHLVLRKQSPGHKYLVGSEKFNDYWHSKLLALVPLFSFFFL